MLKNSERPNGYVESISMKHAFGARLVFSLSNKHRKNIKLQCIERTLDCKPHRQSHGIEPFIEQCLCRRPQRDRLSIHPLYLHIIPPSHINHTFAGISISPFESNNIFRSDFDRILRSIPPTPPTGRRSPPITIFPFSTYTSFFRLQ